MKRVRLYLCALFLLASPCYPATFTATGTVNTLQVLESVVYGPDMDWFTLVGVTALGACKTANGFIVFRIRDDAKGQRMFAVILAAKTSGTALTVWVDDTVTDSGGFCYVRNLQ